MIRVARLGLQSWRDKLYDSRMIAIWIWEEGDVDKRRRDVGDMGVA